MGRLSLRLALYHLTRSWLFIMNRQCKSMQASSQLGSCWPKYTIIIFRPYLFYTGRHAEPLPWASDIQRFDFFFIFFNLCKCRAWDLCCKGKDGKRSTYAPAIRIASNQTYYTHWYTIHLHTLQWMFRTSTAFLRPFPKSAPKSGRSRPPSSWLAPPSSWLAPLAASPRIVAWTPVDTGRWARSVSGWRWSLWAKPKR